VSGWSVVIVVVAVTTAMTAGRTTVATMTVIVAVTMIVAATMTVAATATDGTEIVAATMTESEIETRTAVAAAAARVATESVAVAVEAGVENRTDVVRTKLTIVPHHQLSR